MLVNIQILCFASCYVLALVLEIVGLYRRGTWRRLALLAAVIAGFLTHTLHLAGRAADSATSPLSSPYDWYLLAAWVLAAIYLGQQMYQPQSSAGLFLLPPVLVLIAGAQFADRQQFVLERASRTWGNIHGTSLLLGTVTVMIGFTAGLMYLVQSYRLKHGSPPTQRLRLPSLEWLEGVNSRSLAISAFLIALGFVSGVILNQIRHAGDEDYLPWTDPVVVSLALMLLWLIVAEVFRLAYRAARGGRKVAYLTVATFIFLMISLAVLLFVESGHSPEAAVSAGEKRHGWRGQPWHPQAENRQVAQTFLSVRGPGIATDEAADWEASAPKNAPSLWEGTEGRASAAAPRHPAQFNRPSPEAVIGIGLLPPGQMHYFSGANPLPGPLPEGEGASCCAPADFPESAPAVGGGAA